MPVIKDVLDSLSKIAQLHRKKNDDYATGFNPFSNFDLAIPILNSFSSNRDKVFVWPIAIKIARLGVLLSSSRPPNNESVEDSLLDIATYVLIWKADIVRREEELGKERTRQVDTMEGIIEIPVYPNVDIFNLLKTMPDSQIDELLAFVRQLREARSLGRKGRPLENVKDSEPSDAYTDNQKDVRIQIEPEYSNKGGQDSVDENYTNYNEKNAPKHGTHSTTSAQRLRTDQVDPGKSRGYK